MLKERMFDYDNSEQALRHITAIDVGCGAGLLSESLGRIGLQSVVGIDPTPKCVELAQGHLDLDVTDLNQIVKYENITLEDKLK